MALWNKRTSTPASGGAPTAIGVGSTIAGKYRVEGELGHGGMGVVYKATNLTVGRPVALKVVHGVGSAEEREIAVKRLEREARTISRFHSPHTVRVHDFARTDAGEFFMVMEYLHGQDLSKVIGRGGPMAVGRAVHIVRNVLKSLAEAHAAGVVHRDLKPENLFICDLPGETDYVKVLDFGIAKQVGAGQQGSTVTANGAIIGTPKYMAPEVGQGVRPTPASDLYAVGFILYQMLTGAHAFGPESGMPALIKHINEDVPPPRVGDRALVGPLVDFIVQCVDKDPKARPMSADACLACLDSLGDDAVRLLEPGVAPSVPGPGPVRAFGESGEWERWMGPAPVGTQEVDSEEIELVGAPALPEPVKTGTSGTGPQTSEVATPARWVWMAPLVALLLLAWGGLAWWFVGPEGQPARAGEPGTVKAASLPAGAEDRAEETAEPVVTLAAAPVEPAAQAQIDEPVAAAPTVLRAEVLSEPGGATVSHGQVVLGVTPLEIAWPAGAVRELEVSMGGYAVQRIALSAADAGGVRKVALIAEEKPGAAAVEPRGAPRIQPAPRAKTQKRPSPKREEKARRKYR